MLYPSKYEGFGLPIIEAMACGCPVISYRNSAIPEVAGDAAIYIAEDSPPELADAMLRLSDDTVRAEYRARGFERAGTFSWKRTAAEVESFVREVVAGAGART